VVETLFVEAKSCLSINQAISIETSLIKSIQQGFPLTLALYVMATKALGYILQNQMAQGLKKEIPIPSPKVGHLVNGHLVEDS
jgi:hypothetical protein